MRKGQKCSKIVRARMSLAKSGVNNPMHGKVFTKQHRSNLSCALVGRRLSKAHCISIADGMTKLWKDDRYRRLVIRKTLKGRSYRFGPNKKEQALRKLLSKLFYASYKFVGDGKVVINGKNPDFINKKKRKIIELFGTFWHKKCHIKRRRRCFKKCGYETLVVWDFELKNIDKLTRKLIRFDGR